MSRVSRRIARRRRSARTLADSESRGRVARPPLLSSTPKVGEMIRAIRGQPNRGFPRLSSTIALMRSGDGPLGPDLAFRRHGHSAATRANGSVRMLGQDVVEVSHNKAGSKSQQGWLSMTDNQVGAYRGLKGEGVGQQCLDGLALELPCGVGKRNVDRSTELQDCLPASAAGRDWSNRSLCISSDDDNRNKREGGPFGPDCDLRRYGERLAARGGKVAKRKARIAVARKLAVLLHRLWVTGEIYEPLRGARQTAEAPA